jgi:hypothetical protein
MSILYPEIEPYYSNMLAACLRDPPLGGRADPPRRHRLAVPGSRTALSRASELVIVPGAGHSTFDPGMDAALVEATRRWSRR